MEKMMPAKTSSDSRRKSTGERRSAIAAPIQRPFMQRAVYDFSRIGVRVLGKLLFNLTLRGIDRFPKSGGALVCSNHQSYLDPILLGSLCNRRMNYLARESLFESGFLSVLMRYYDAIPVRRDGMSISGLKETLKRLKRGELVVIFPEGTRTEDGKISPLKSGFCMLARKAKVPLVPVAISGAYEVWPKGQRPKLARIVLEAGDPIPAETVAELDDDALVALVAEKMHGVFDSAEALRTRKRGEQ